MDKIYINEIPIYVVSLESAVDRRAHIESQMKFLNCKFQYIDAVKAVYDDSPTDSIKRGDALSSASYAGKMRPNELTPGEIACSLSHMKCYGRIVESETRCALILEDDAHLIGLNKRRLERAAEVMRVHDIDVLLIGYSKLSLSEAHRMYQFMPIRRVVRDGHFAFGPIWKEETCGTVGYMISDRGASKLLEFQQIAKDRGGLYKADAWDVFRRYGRLRIWHIRPLMVLEAFSTFPSGLEADRKTPQRNRKFDKARAIRGRIRWYLMNMLHKN